MSAEDEKKKDAEPLLTPIRSISCGIFSQNIRDYVTNFDPLINAISALTFRESVAVRRLKEHNQNVHRAMGDMRRYIDYNRKLNNDRSKTTEEKQKILTDQNAAIATANTKYLETSKQYQTQIEDLAKSLDATNTMQECQQTIQSTSMAQSLVASKLIAIPDQMCAEFKSAYAAFEKALHAAYILIGAPVPR